MVVRVRGDQRDNSKLLSAVEKDRKTRQLQFLKNLEVVLRDANVGNEGTGYGFRRISFPLSANNVNNRGGATYFQALFQCCPQHNSGT